MRPMQTECWETLPALTKLLQSDFPNEPKRCAASQPNWSRPRRLGRVFVILHHMARAALVVALWTLLSTHMHAASVTKRKSAPPEIHSGRVLQTSDSPSPPPPSPPPPSPPPSPPPTPPPPSPPPPSPPPPSPPPPSPPPPSPPPSPPPPSPPPSPPPPSPQTPPQIVSSETKLPAPHRVHEYRNL